MTEQNEREHAWEIARDEAIAARAHRASRRLAQAEREEDWRVGDDSFAAHLERRNGVVHD